MKRIISIIICIALALSLPGFFTFSSFADGEKAEVSTEDISGNPKDTVYAPIKIRNNPGFSDIAFSLSFDKSSLSYVGAHNSLISGFTVYDHTKDGKIVVSYTGKHSISDDGILMCFEFKINDKAKDKTYPLKISKLYITNEKAKSIKCETSDGSLKVQKSCEGEHQYLDWHSAVTKTCTKNGIQVRYCQLCGNSQSRISEATGHSVNREFNIDVIAEGSKSGMLSRKCSVCGAKTNIVVYNKKNDAALSLNDMPDSFSESTIDTLVYFFNGGKTYPDIDYDVTDVDEFIRDNSSDSSSGIPAVNDDKTINVDVAVDRIMRWIFGNEKDIGIIDALKRAAIADELPLKLLCKLVCLILV